ncbi:MAG TPA: vitamin K epoxide reductase family protein [Dictyobacter sp.]|jgi:uncharacterized membrane protein|nr:vitamin K epoxide reductase family protein [Dictyobacter sp.]
MSDFRRSGGQIAILALSVIGVIISIYLTMVHYNSKVTLVCSSSGLVNCERVITSSFSYVPGTSLPITLPGLFWFAVSGVSAALAWRGVLAPRLASIVQLIWSALAMITVFYLIYVELVRLHNICAWCTVLHIAIFITLLISVVLFQQASSDDDLLYEDEEDEGEGVLSNASVKY